MSQPSLFRVHSEFEKNEFTSEWTREQCTDSQTRTGLRVNPWVR